MFYIKVCYIKNVLYECVYIRKLVLYLNNLITICTCRQLASGQEMEQVLRTEAPNLSPHERSEFARWIDRDGDGVLATG